MSKRCGNCGEVILGAVNRCWNCGRTFSNVHSHDEPPVRRAPIDLATVLQSADPELAAGGPSLDDPAGAPAGSPFATLAEAVPDPDPTGRQAKVKRPRYPRPAAADGASIAASVLTGIALLVFLFSDYPAVCLGIAFFGLWLGVWGLKARRRGIALAAILTCCLLISLSALAAGVQLYIRIHGHGPFEPPAAEFE